MCVAVVVPRSRSFGIRPAILPDGCLAQEALQQAIQCCSETSARDNTAADAISIKFDYRIVRQRWVDGYSSTVFDI